MSDQALHRRATPPWPVTPIRKGRMLITGRSLLGSGAPSTPLLTALTLSLIVAAIIPHPSAAAQSRYDDHQNMMDQLGIKALRRGPDPNNQSTFDEATANPYKDTMPDALTFKDGQKVAKAAQWPKRR